MIFAVNLDAKDHALYLYDDGWFSDWIVFYSFRCSDFFFRIAVTAVKDDRFSHVANATQPNQDFLLRSTL